MAPRGPKIQKLVPSSGKVGPSWAKLGPSWSQVGAKLGQVGTKWRPSWRSCRLVPASLCPCASKDPSERHPSPLEPKMLPNCCQHARAESHEMRALLIRNILFQFRWPSALGALLTPHLGPIFCPSWFKLGLLEAKFGPSWLKLAPSWRQIGPSWGSWRHLEASWKHLVGKLDQVGANLAQVGALGGILDAKSKKNLAGGERLDRAGGV